MLEFSQKEEVSFSRSDYVIPILFLLSLSLLGLKLPFIIIAVLGLLLFTWKRSRYDFLIQLTFLIGGYGFYDLDALGLKLADIGLLFCFLGCFLCIGKSRVISKLIYLTFLYVAVLLLFAYISDEPFFYQLRRLRQYVFIIYFIAPLLVFLNREFSIIEFFKRLVLYVSVVASFYIIDSIVWCNNILLPYANPWNNPLDFLDIEFHFFSGMLRVYPQGLFMIGLLIYPLIYCIDISIKRYVLLGLGILTTKTISVIAGIILTYFIMVGSFSKKIKTVSLAIILFTGLAIADNYLGGSLRINQFFQQIDLLVNSDSVEDYAQFGSGRGAQIAPKFFLLSSMNKVWTGFGFLHPEFTVNEKYLIENDLYSDEYVIEEIGQEVEVTQIQTILDIGVIGFIIQHVFYILIYFILKDCYYKNYYLFVLVTYSLFGLGGFCGLTTMTGLLLVGLCLGSILLEYENEKAVLD